MAESKSRLLLASILILSALFRLYNIGLLPQWYWDEGANMDMAWNIVHGKLIWFALTFPAIPHPPLYFLIAGTLLRMFGNELIVLRVLSAILGVLTTFLLYRIGREIKDTDLGLLTAFLYAIYPVAVYWGRMAFSYNLLMLLNMLVLYYSTRYLKTARDTFMYAASILTGLAVVTVYTGIATYAGLAILLYLTKKSDLLKFMAIASLPLAILMLSMLVIMPDALLDDVLFQINRFGMTKLFASAVLLVSIIAFIRTSNTLSEFFGYTWRYLRSYSIKRLFEQKTFIAKYDLPIMLIALNYLLATSFSTPLTNELLLRGVTYFWIGIIGILLLEDRRAVFSFFLPLFVLTLKMGRTDHMTIPLNPFLCLGVAIFLIRIHEFVISFKNVRRYDTSIILLLLIPFSLVICQDLAAFIDGNLGSEQISDRMRLTEFLNNNTALNDVVLVDSNEVRFLKAMSSTLAQGIAINGEKISYYHANISPERFVFNCSYKNAKYIVLRPGDIEWLYEETPSIAVEIDGWQVVYVVGRYTVYENQRVLR